MWASERDRRTKASVLSSRRNCERIIIVNDINRNTGVDELQQPFARSVRCWIVGQDHDASHTGGDQGVGTRRRTTVVSAGLERDVDRRIARALLRNIKRHRFGMSLAWPDVPALCDDRAVARNYTPDEWIRRSGSCSTLGQLERTG